MNSSLYKIENLYLNLMSEAESQEGVLTDEQNALLNFTTEEWATKSEQFCKIIKTLEADVAFCDTEMERINKVKASKELMIKRFKDSLLGGLKLFGEKDAKKDIWRSTVGTFKLGTTKSTPVIIDEDIIDDKYKTLELKDKITYQELAKLVEATGKTFKTEVHILKTPIKELLQAGEIIEGAEISEKFSLSIK
jgi:Siphovirus Gp157